MKICIKALYLFIFSMLIIVGDADGRSFTDTKGRVIQAKILDFNGGHVLLKLEKNDKTYEVSIDNLSEADRAFIAQWVNKKQAAQEVQEDHNHAHSQAGDNGHTSALMKQYNLKENFDSEWPKLVSTDIGIDIGVVSESEEAKEFVYHSPNYEFVCDVELTKNVVKKFAVMFEATRDFCRLLPVSMMKAHVPGGEYRHKILLFENRETYLQKGGVPGSAGVFITRGGNGVVMVPLTSLGVIKGKAGYRYDYDKSNKTLMHEVVHQLTDVEYFLSGARGWFSEGLAEYIAITPYRSGKYMVRSNLSEIRDYVTAYGEKGRGGRALTDEIKAPSLESFMLQSYENFTRNGNFNYGLGLLLTYYFFHMEDDRSNINAFLAALKDGHIGQGAVDKLLGGRSYEELEQQIAKAWKSRGIRISFR